MSGRSGFQETGAELDIESVATTLCGSIETQTLCAFVERPRKSPKILEVKVDLAVRGERVAQQKLYEAF